MDKGTTEIYIFGASGHGSAVYSVLLDLKFEIKGFIDSDLEKITHHELPIFRWQELPENPISIVAIGTNHIRKQIVKDHPQIRYIKAVHPTAYVNTNTLMGEGSVVMQNATIQINSRIGRHCIINTGTCVDHDCILEDYSHVSPNATLAGGVSVGEGAWIGSGAVVLPGLKIGKWSIVGAGSVVTRDVGENEVVIGSPAMKIKEIKK